MNTSAFLLILLSCGLHASWNFLSKKNTPSCGFFFLTNIAAVIATAPFTFFGPVDYTTLSLDFWMMVFFSVLCEIAYILSLANGYRKAEISFFYPMARSLPVLFTFGLSTMLGVGKSLSVPAMIGMVLVTSGCIILPMQSFKKLRFKDYWNSTTPYVLLGACGTTGYTMFDSAACNYLYKLDGMNRSLAALSYFGVIEIGILIGMSIIQLCSSTERKNAAMLYKNPAPYFSGFFSVLAYGMVLIAMGMVSNVSYIQAFRQLSLPIGVVLGIILLHEKVTLPKLIGVVILITGLMLTAF